MNKYTKILAHSICGKEVIAINKEDVPKKYKGHYRFYYDIDKPYYCVHCKKYLFKGLSHNKTVKKLKEAGKW